MSLGRPFSGSAGPAPLRLGLIGDNIARSRAPELHRLAGEIVGIPVSYERLVPRDMQMDFATVFEHCAASGYRGVNITYPYKETAALRVELPDPLIRQVGAVNTVIFGPAGIEGHNTDLTGFVAAYRRRFGLRSPGKVALVGAGGVGRAVAFGLVALGVRSIRVADIDRERARRLAADLAGAAATIDIGVAADPATAAAGVDGVLNCTPRGMDGDAGSAIPAAALGGQRWAFDAVYTPVETPFLRDAAAAGFDCFSGYELFFHQGVEAFRIFTGCDVSEQELRRRLAESGMTAAQGAKVNR
jgi:shikimate dehydrogenase